MSNHARVLFFATLRDLAGTHEVDLEFPEGSQISDIKTLVLDKFPALQKNMETIIVAMNHEFAFDEAVVLDGAEVAMFPPVSGGDDHGTSYPTVIELVDKEIDLNALVAKITLPTTGAVSVFAGTVRGFTNRGIERHTEHLIYEAYQVMATDKMMQIAREIRSRWKDIEGIAMVQRIGKLMPGMVSVLIACASPHRDSGIFEAAKYGIDRLKEIVPVWKKEVGLDGEEWVEGDYIPHQGE
jgi:molybdopterin converting factor subunit 1